MKIKSILLSTVLLRIVLLTLAPVLLVFAESEKRLTPNSVIENSRPSDWRSPEQKNLLYMQLDAGEVVFELAHDFAPQHIANLRLLLEDDYFDGLAIIRSHDNYVVQWGDQHAENAEAKSLGDAKSKISGEFSRGITDLEFSPINSQDPYADKVGFSKGFAVGADEQKAWLIHCYGALGVGRGMAADSGNTSSLYMVSGHAPRHLDRNITLIGRAIKGFDLLSSLPRGTGPLGFYETIEESTVIKSIRLGSQLSREEQREFEIMRTDTKTFDDYVRSRTFRQNEWFLEEVGRIGICNVGVPIRAVNKKVN